MLRNLANDDGYVALKWAAENIEGWKNRKNVENLTLKFHQNTTNYS